MQKQLFTIDGFKYPHIGYTEGKRWNGWATPYFEIDEALKVMEEFNKEQPEHLMMYAEASGTFMLKIAEDEIDLWKGKNYETEEGIKHLYSIGAYSWVWELTTEDDILAVAQRAEDFIFEFDSYGYKDAYDDREAVVKEIENQLKDFNILKQALIYLYTEELTEEELFDKLGGILNV